MRDGRLSRSPFVVLLGKELFTAVIFDAFEDVDDDDDGSAIAEEVNGDGCSGNAIDEEDDGGIVSGGGGSRSALGTEFEPS